MIAYLFIIDPVESLNRIKDSTLLLMKECLKETKTNPKSELLWASPRELLNIIQADQIGCHIITVTKDIIKKLQLINYDLDEYSLDTVKMFYKDAVKAKFKINK